MDAYSLLLKTDYPSWLYEVRMGATTVWERWNSVLPDGHISGTGMNSLNHYSYGSIVEWMYRYMCGLNQTAPGFKTVRFQPMPDPENRVGKVQMVYDAAAGRYTCGWEKTETGYRYLLTVPFDCEAEVVLPSGRTETVGTGSYTFEE
jgi:alpha-L-rhamnosidase